MARVRSGEHRGQRPKHTAPDTGEERGRLRLAEGDENDAAAAADAAVATPMWCVPAGETLAFKALKEIEAILHTAGFPWS